MRVYTDPGWATATAGQAVMGQPQNGGRAMRAAGYGQPPNSNPKPPAGNPAARRRPDNEAFYAQRHRLRVWAGVRNEVVHRLVEMNLRHSMHAWNVRRDRPVAPWAVGFLYTYATGTVYDGIELYQVAAATRLVDDDETLPGPAHLLYRLAGVAHERHRDEYGWFDPTALCTYRDQVPRTATYLGVAVSCLGNQAEPWEELRRGDSDDIPGHAYAVLADDGALLVKRGGRRDLRRVVVHATADLSHQYGLTGFRWIAEPDEVAIPGADPDVWEQLHGLHAIAGHQNPLPTLEPAPTNGRPA
jgi:hypothetical protein